VSYTDAISDFMAFMETAGVVASEPIAQRLGSGNLIRFRCEGDGKGRKNGWAILYLDDRPAGAFGNYKLNTGTLKWKSGEDRPALSKSEREALQREWREKKAERENEKRQAELEASYDAADMWARGEPARPDHPYLDRKHVRPGALRQLGGQLLVPMFDGEGTLWNLQRISGDGQKRFLQGGRVEDLFCIIGDFTPECGQAVLCEGYATGDSIHQAVSLPLIVAFSSANLVRVARLWGNARPDVEFTIFADDDEATAQRELARTGVYKNPGIEAAHAAAAETGFPVAYPRSARERFSGEVAA
jgi:putative DNA primase/helicase